MDLRPSSRSSGARPRKTSSVAIFQHVLVILTLTATVWPCAVGEVSIEVPPAFVVHISNDYGPVVGLTIHVIYFREEEYKALSSKQKRTAHIEDFEDVVDSATTDGNGDARFHLKKTGGFFIEANHASGAFMGVNLVVKENSSHPDRLPFKWPETSILETQTLRGKIVKGLLKGSGQGAIGGAELSLHELGSYRLMRSTKTADDGSFEFGDIPPGLYLLDLKSRQSGSDQLDGDIPISISPKAVRNSLSLMVSETDCGLMYDLEENERKYVPIICMKAGLQVPCNN